MISGGILSFLLVSSLYVTVSCANRLTLQNAGTTTIRAEDTASIMIRKNTKCNRNCSMVEKQYFCASNGRTLDSQCKVDKALCEDNLLKFKPGKCQDSERCRLERNHISLKIQNQLYESVHLPACESDGTYSKVQCDPHLGFCWCVTSSGRMIRDSTVKLGVSPPCIRSNSKRKTRCKTLPDRVVFVKNLRDLIVEEYSRSKKKKSPDALQKDPIIIRRSAIWKHTKSDKNKDANLSKKDVKKLLRSYRKKIPRPCRNILLKHCDYDNNKKVSLNEWLICLGASPKGGDILIQTVGNKPPLITQTTETNNVSRDIDKTTDVAATSPLRPHTCREAKDEILRANNLDVMVVPQCEGENLEYWSPVQCSEKMGYCWCVLRENGRPFYQTSVKNGKPNCDESAPINVPIPGCPTKLKAKFLAGVQNILLSKMYPARNTDSPLQPENDNSVRYYAEAVRTYFDALDENNDGVWNHSEIKKFKKLLSGHRLPKRCLRKFTQHCDRNKNRKTTKDELIECLEVTRQDKLPLRTLSSGAINQLRTSDDLEYF